MARFDPVRVALVARRDWVEAMNLLAEPNEPVLRARYGVPVVVVVDPDAARQVLIEDADAYGRPWAVSNVMSDALGDTMFLAEGDDWLRRRQRVTPVFGRAHADGLARLMAETAFDEVAQWTAATGDDVQVAVTALTMRIACRALLGVDPASDELGDVIRDRFGAILEWITHRFTRPLSPPAAAPTARNRRLRAAKADLDDAVRRLIARRRVAPSDSLDVLGLLLHAQAEGDGPTDDEIVAECVGFLFAGHETNASTLTWALYELATHPQVQARVASEGDSLELTDTDLFHASETLDVTARVIDETLRLYPAGIGIARAATRRTTLAGHPIRRHTIVLIAVYAMQRGAAWPDPNQFDPDRAFPNQPAPCDGAGYLPFGWGPRRCLGARFATAEARLALALICSRWQLRYEHATPPRAAVLPSLRVDGPLRLELTRREHSERQPTPVR